MAIDKLNKTFVRGAILKAEELNEMVSKTNEIIDNTLILGTSTGTAFDGGEGELIRRQLSELNSIINNIPQLIVTTLSGYYAIPNVSIKTFYACVDDGVLSRLYLGEFLIYENVGGDIPVSSGSLPYSLPIIF